VPPGACGHGGRWQGPTAAHGDWLPPGRRSSLNVTTSGDGGTRARGTGLWRGRAHRRPARVGFRSPRCQGQGQLGSSPFQRSGGLEAVNASHGWQRAGELAGQLGMTRGGSSAGQSSGLIIRRSWVRSPAAPRAGPVWSVPPGTCLRGQCCPGARGPRSLRACRAAISWSTGGTIWPGRPRGCHAAEQAGAGWLGGVRACAGHGSARTRRPRPVRWPPGPPPRPARNRAAWGRAACWGRVAWGGAAWGRDGWRRAARPVVRLVRRRSIAATVSRGARVRFAGSHSLSASACAYRQLARGSGG
jgi:hypothetical protein